MISHHSNRRRWLAALATVAFNLALAAALTGMPPNRAALAVEKATSANTSPVGLWKTFDDKTGAARAIVRIYEENGKLWGRIVHSFTPGSEEHRCEVCTDDRKNAPIIGLIIIRNMHADGGEWNGGDILDPESGSVYRCKLRLDKDGRVLDVRGYIGLSLLGRTQTWQRQPEQ